MDSFAKRFKQLRSEKGLSQKELRLEFNEKYYRNYKPSAISYYETGKRMPEIDSIKDFADFFGVSISYLLGDSDVRNPDDLELVQPSEENLWGKIKSLSPKDREKAEEYITMLKILSEIKSGEKMVDFAKKA